MNVLCAILAAISISIDRPEPALSETVFELTSGADSFAVRGTLAAPGFLRLKVKCGKVDIGCYQYSPTGQSILLQ